MSITPSKNENSHYALPLTVVIPVLNEARNLPHCLRALKNTARVIVIDSGSTDETVKIAQEFGASVLNFDWNGQYPKKRNWYLIHHTPMTPWVLFLDADEMVTDNFLDELKIVLSNENLSGYWIKYTNYFLGKELKYGLPQKKLALFRVGKGLYERIEENMWSSLDMEIHEHPVIDGKIGTLKSLVDHRDFQGVGKFLQRHVDYAKWEAQRTHKLGKIDSPNWQSLTKRQKFKYKHLSRWWFPGFYFINAYLLRAGFLDGKAGLHYAYYKMWYFNSIRLMIKEKD